MNLLVSIQTNNGLIFVSPEFRRESRNDRTMWRNQLGFTEVEKMIQKGDKVIMNGKYYVSEKNKGKKFLLSNNIIM